MSGNTHREAAARGIQAAVFGALGDATRLALVARLARGERRSISDLADGAAITRQAITRHLRVLEHAGVVRHTRLGRESLFERPRKIDDARNYLANVSAQWDEALSRLKRLVED